MPNIALTAATYASKMAHHLRAHGGCLIIDYGRDGQSGDSLQAVANHQPVDVFYQPGSADLSHWVDFSAIRRVAEEAGARLIGPITQGEFLRNIGIIQRSESIGKTGRCRKPAVVCLQQLTGLVSNQQMGSALGCVDVTARHRITALALPLAAKEPPYHEQNKIWHQIRC